MPLITAFTLVRAMSLFHMTAAYYFLTSPRTMAEQATVTLLGQAMQIPATTDFLHPTQVTALLALVLAFLAVSDLVAASMNQLAALEYWTSQTPIRLVMLFGLTAYTYLTRDGGFFGTSSDAATFGMASSKKSSSTGEHIRTDLIFSLAFIELCMWFWIYVSLRDERRALGEKLAERQKFIKDNQL